MTTKNNPFAKVGASPKLGTKTYSVEDVKASNRRFYEKTTSFVYYSSCRTREKNEKFFS